MTDGSDGGPVARGLARNPASPPDLLLRLLRDHPEALHPGLHHRADLPAVVVEAAARHPDAEIRAAIAGNPHLDPGVRLGMLDDPSHRVALRVINDVRLPLPARAFTIEIDRLLLFHRRGLMTAPELTGELHDIVARDRRALDVIAAHPEPVVRAAAVGRVDAGTPLWARLAEDEAPEVRETAIRHAVNQARLHEVANLPRNGYDARAVVARRHLSRALIDHVLAGGQYAPAMAANPHLPPEVLETLLAHPSAQVRAAVAGRRDLTRTQLDRLIADPDVTVRAAVSVHPALGEADRAAIDLDVTTASGNGGAAGREHRPALPADGPARFAGDPEPAVRALAPGDPAIAPHVLEQLLTDPEPAVRHAAAAGPALPVDRIVALLDDPDPETVEAAASNAALPVPLMWSALQGC